MKKTLRIALGLVLVGFALQSCSDTTQPIEEGPSFGKAKGTEKFTVCHEGKTITVASPAIADHFAHGDGNGIAPPSGLVSWWPGDGDATDIQADRHGELKNGATTAPGFVGDAFSFDGVDDYLLIPYNKLGGLFETGTDYTVTLWANKVLHQLSPYLLSLTGTTPCNSGIDFWFYGNNANSSEYGSAVVDVYTPCKAFAVARGVGDVPNDEWVFLSVAYDNANLFLYVNGELVKSDLEGTPGWTKPSASKAGGLVIGTASHTTSGPAVHNFKGLMDEIQVYDRALAPEEMQAIYEAGSAGMCKP